MVENCTEISMDRGKPPVKRGPKSKVLPLPGDFIALGPKAAKGVENLDLKLSSSSGNSSHKQSQHHAVAGTSGDRKRDVAIAASSSALGPQSKKSKLSFSSGSRTDENRERGDVIGRGELWDASAIEVDPWTLLEHIEKAEETNSDERIEKLLCGAVKQLRTSRAKPDSALYLSLIMLAKTRPTFFCTDRVTSAFCSLLKRDMSANFKSKGNALVSILAANLMMAAYQDDRNWPELFIKVYLEDALAERSWVDHEDCKGFVENLQTAFMTKMPPKGFLLQPELAFKTDVSASPPPAGSIDPDDDTMDSVHSVEGRGDKMDIVSFPRYGASQDSVGQYTLEIIRDQLTRRQPMDNVSRNMLKVLSHTAGLSEIRLLVAQKLEMWLQNPKLMRPAQELLLSVCLNCNLHNQQDVEVIGYLIKIRLKTKPLISHYLLCIRELLEQHPDNLSTVLKHTVYNELSNSRNPNNMGLLGAIFQHSPEPAAKLLAEVFQDVLNNRDDYLRAIRGLFREVARSLRHDINFPVFCLGLMKERKESQFKDLEQQLKDRLFLAIADLVTLSIFLSITPAVREAASAFARGDKKDMSVLRVYQRQVAVIQRDAVWWLHTIVPKMFKPGRNDFVHCLHKVLFMEQQEHYYNKDNWPMENDRLMMLRLASEAPLLEDTLMRVLVIGLSKEHPMSPPDALELADQLVKRAAMLYMEDFHVIQAERVELINAVFNLCAYHHPENITLPQTYQAPNMAISSLYWKAWVTLLIVTAHNPVTFGQATWDNYPTLRSFMEMCITNHFVFPPPTMAMGERADEIRAKEHQLCQLEKQQILEFESHLASVSVKTVITESNSHLLSQLTTMDPRGVARRPPSQILEQLKSLNQTLKLGHLLCRSRNPDFLLDIIQRQGTSQSMPWLAELVESSEGAFHVLPVQCLCEFLLNETSVEETDFDFENSDSKEESKTEKAERAKRKEKKRKHQRLLRHLQERLYNKNNGPQATFEVLDYFLRRLSSQQSSARIQAVKGLSMVLQPPSASDEEMDVDDLDRDIAIGQHSWLLKHLPSLAHFSGVQAAVSAELRQACQVENNPAMISGYIRFLARYAPDEQLQDLADLTLDMAQLVVERTTIVNCILPYGTNGTTDYTVLSALFVIFVKYLRRAREPSKEEYCWSESQDHILVQWASGEAATMHIRVVNAMVILLTYGPSTDPSLFDELLEIWFPCDQDPPQAFLVDTSEEALLLPDWLKLRMIRSNVERLVDAALHDLDPGQLVLFLQSFGIPVSSVSKLLECLDIAVGYESFAVEQAVVDKSYMSQLVEIQQQRGAVGGRRFMEFLMAKESLPNDEDELELMPLPSQIAKILPAKPTIASEACTIVDQLAILFNLHHSVPPCTKKEQLEILRSIEKGLTLEIMSKEKKFILTKTIVGLVSEVLNSSDAARLVKTLHSLRSVSCALIRLLITAQKKVAETDSAYGFLLSRLWERIVALSSQIKPLWTPLVSLLKGAQYYNKVQGDDRLHSNIPLDSDGIFTEIGKVVSENPQRLEEVVSTFVRSGVRSGKGGEVAVALRRLMIEGAEKGKADSASTGFLVDWLEMLEPEVIGYSSELQQQRLLFQHEGKGKGGCLYLLSVVAHQTNWTTLRKCIGLVLAHDVNSSDKSLRFDPTAVLDFLWACVHNPKIWQGRDKHVPKHYIEENILGLNCNQVLQVVNYILQEASSSGKDNESDSTAKVFSRVLESRLPLLLHCCSHQRDIHLCLVTHLEKLIHTNGNWSVHSHHLLLLLYVNIPYIVKFVKDIGKFFEGAECTLTTPSKLDPVLHNLLMILAGTESGKDWKDKIDDVDMVCRKMASSHPLLFLRQLPMLYTALRGRVQWEFCVFSARNHLQYFVVVFGLLELLQPYIFRKEYNAELQEICESYFDVIKIHGYQKKDVGPLISRFLLFISEFLAFDTQRSLRYIQKHASVLSGLSTVYPDLPSLRSILSAVSLPCQMLLSDAESQGQSEGMVGEAPPLTFSFTPPQQMPSWTQAQIAPIASRLSKEESFDDVIGSLHDLDSFSFRKPVILEPFLIELKRLMAHVNDSCRNLAYNLVVRYMKQKPSSSKGFVSSYLCCLDDPRPEIVCTALERLAEFILLCQEDASQILQKAFQIDITSNINTVLYIGESIMVLNMQAGC